MTNLAMDVDMIMVQKEEKEIYTRQLTGSKSKRSRRMEEICKMGTWNVRGLAGKEKELVEEFEKAGLDFLAIVETKKKGQGEMELGNGNVLIYGGVAQEKWARAGVGCVISKSWKDKLQNKQIINERIMTIELTIGSKGLTVIIVYGPDESEKAEIKEEFWYLLNIEVENAKGEIMVIGDFNSRVGKGNKISQEVVGQHGEMVRNSNGNRLIQFCIENQLIVTNTFYEHKDIHKYTREVKSRKERSIIDYILVEKQHRNRVKDVRVKRGAELYSDHYLVVVKILGEQKSKGTLEPQEKVTNCKYETIRAYKLNDAEVVRQYQQQISTEYWKIKEHIKERDPEQVWMVVKGIILEAARRACGTSKVRKNQKQTAWWTPQIKEEVKIKKKLWKESLTKKTREAYYNYKKQRKKVKDLVKQEKQKTWEEFGKRMEENSKGNQKLFYKTLKTLRKEKQRTTVDINDRNGQVIREEVKIKERWVEYFRELLGVEGQINRLADSDIRESTQKGSRRDGENEEIRAEEVIKAIQRLKIGKAAGIDKIKPEMIKFIGEDGIEMLRYLFNKIWKETKIPQEWEVGIIVPIFKKGDTKECKNYRGITLLSVVAKVYERILEEKLRNKIEQQLAESQSGFRRGYGIQDHIFTIKQVSEKILEQNLEAHIAFIDLEKAFDRIPRHEVWRALEERQVDTHLVNAIKSMYKQCRNKIRRGTMETEEFKTEQGLRQGSILSPTLFLMIMDEVIKEATLTTKKLEIGYKNLGKVGITECVFADDLAVFAKSEKDLQYNINIWNDALRKRNMKVNAKKTKVMVISREKRNINIQIDGDKIEQVEDFKYLGNVFEVNGRQDIEINERIKAAMRVYGSLGRSFIGKREVSKQTKIKVFKSIYRPVLTFGSETWVLTKKQKSRIQATEMKYLRRIKGINRTDRVRNQDVREELGIESVLTVIERNQLRWYGHLNRMGDNRQVKSVWEARTIPRRKRGRPGETWKQVIEKVLAKKGYTIQTAKMITQNKKEWRALVYKEAHNTE